MNKSIPLVTYSGNQKNKSNKKKYLLLIFFVLYYNSIFAQTFTISGNVYNDPYAGTVNNSATPFSLPREGLRVVLIEAMGDTIAASVTVNAADGSFLISPVPPGSYYAILITPNVSLAIGAAPPVLILENGWTHTGESLLASGIPDASIDGKTGLITVNAGNISNVKFGIQERPFADNKMNDSFDNSSVNPVLLSVNIVAALTDGGAAILSGADNSGGSITNYTINVLPKYGTLYLGSTPVTTLSQVATLTPAAFATLAYLPAGTALKEEQDLFTYYVTDNAMSLSNNAVYVIPFALLESDGDTYADRNDFDDDNDGITDVQECSLNNFSNLLNAYIGNEFTFIRPSMFGYSIAHRSGIDTTVDISSSFGYPANSGAIIVTVSNANTHPTANEFYVNEATGPTQWAISGTVGAYTSIEHGQQYFSYDTRSITILNGTSEHFLIGQQGIDPLDSKWLSGNDGYTWRLTSDTTLRMSTANNNISNPRLGILSMALTGTEPKYFQVASTANNFQEWATYFVLILPECDYDNDGIPNRLDLDSDNDNCLDALEGNQQFEYSAIDNAGGTVRTGNGSSAANSNLCADFSCVDSNGIPLPVAGGQAPEGTYNELLIADVCNIPLTVTLTGFNAIKENSHVLLQWTTGSEDKNKGFEIEKSKDGRTWKTIGFVKSQSENGNKNLQSDYNFVDNDPVTGQNFYRLKQLDFDGKFAYSPVRIISFDQESNISIYPNPAHERINITGLEGGESIKVYDVAGRLMYQQKAPNATTMDISLDKIEMGIYYMHITGKDGSTASRRIVKIK